VIISRTPFRISFLGGGTDLPDFYRGEEGAVLSTTIDKYMYITVNNRFDSSYRLSYSETEICANVSDIRHRIFRTVLNRYAADAKSLSGGRGLEILSMADVPSGTGLGSSSSFTVGLLKALRGHISHTTRPESLAQEASKIEIEELGEPIGKQDQYAAAYGGLNYVRFLPSGEVLVEPVATTEATRQNLQSSLLVFYTGVTRSASGVLEEQMKNINSKQVELRAMRDLATQMKRELEVNSSMERIGALLNEGWQLKKSLASGISGGQIDEWYQRAMKAGAWGGKILGAGGGGFLMLMVDPSRREKIKRELRELQEFQIQFENQGSQIIFTDK
jgi:D-glycero-alpha-D-manno-heptose-7-phosphate kinase